MQILVLTLILLSFLEATIIPLNLVLIVLIARAFIKEEKENLYLAFVFGLLLSHLNLMPLGILSIIYLVIIKLVHLLSHTRLAKHFLLIIPLSLSMLGLEHILISLIFNKTIYLSWVLLVEAAITLPTFFVLRVWEERFIPKKEIKLKYNP